MEGRSGKRSGSPAGSLRAGEAGNPAGSLRAGEAIPSLRITPDRYLPHRYAGASGDFNPIHLDPEFARSVGLPGNILHGLYGMALVARAATAAAGGDPRALRRLRVQFRGMAVPEREITVSGTVREVDADADAGRATVDLMAEQAGAEIVRHGEAEIVRHGEAEIVRHGEAELRP